MNDCQDVEVTIFSDEGGGGLQDGRARTGTQAKVSMETERMFQDLVAAHIPAIERSMGLTDLVIKEPPFFFGYAPGDFFGLHHDDRFGRTVNISVYLNDELEAESTDSDGYTGGQLSFHGLIPGNDAFGLPTRGVAGHLVAYPSHLMHQVSPILSGNRRAVVQFLHRS